MSNIDDLIYISSPAIASLILSFIFKDIRIFYGGIIYSSTIYLDIKKSSIRNKGVR